MKLGSLQILSGRIIEGNALLVEPMTVYFHGRDKLPVEIRMLGTSTASDIPDGIIDYRYEGPELLPSEIDSDSIVTDSDEAYVSDNGTVP